MKKTNRSVEVEQIWFAALQTVDAVPPEFRRPLGQHDLFERNDEMIREVVDRGMLTEEMHDHAMEKLASQATIQDLTNRYVKSGDEGQLAIIERLVPKYLRDLGEETQALSVMLAKTSG